MYEKHPVFENPDNENAKIWRFIDFTKYVSMLNSNALYFCRSDLFDDLFEGSYSKPTFDAINQLEGLGDKGKISMIQTFAMMQKFWPKGHFLNCWHINEYESDAMWKLYSTDLGVAIQSTFKKFTKSITDEKTVYIGKVKYVDYNVEQIPSGNSMYPYVHKRLSYEHEHELRALLTHYPEKWNEEPKVFDSNPNGITIKIDLNELIETVYVSPRAPLWFKELVLSISKKYELNKNIETSLLSERPYFK